MSGSPVDDSLTARLATAGDAVAIARIHNQGIAERIPTFATQPRTPAQVVAQLAQKGDRFPTVVIELGGEVIAWASVGVYRETPWYAGIGEHSVYSDQDFRGRGAGLAALDALCAACVEQGFWKLVSRIFPENTASLALHERAGFRVVGTYHRHSKLDGQWRDCVIVEKLIGGRGGHMRPLPTSLRPLAAELIGTFALVFAGTGAVIIDATTGGGVGHIGVGLTSGLVIMVMIYAVGHVSGAHFNPAVTLGFAVGRHFPWRVVPRYWAAQLVGGLAASLLLRSMFGNVANLGATLPYGSAAQSFVLEAVLTFVLMFVITSVATDVRAVSQAAAIAIGGTIGLEALFAGPISGASMNPARSLAPALVSWTWDAQWLYVAGPMLGAVAGVLAYQLVRGETEGSDVESVPTSAD